MDSQLVQRTRYQLQTRVRAAKTCPLLLFTATCGHLLGWIDNHPLLSALISPLHERVVAFENRLTADLAKLGTRAQGEIQGPWETASREDAAALAIAALRAVLGKDVVENDERKAYVIALVAAGHNPEEYHGSKPEEVVEALRDVCIQGLYEYLDEEIDTRNAVLGLLVKYRHRCEMYRRHRLRQAALEGQEGRKGEKALAFDLYEYLHDQGVDFWIESKSASGEPDLVSRDVKGERLVADAKYVSPDLEPSKIMKVVASGFRQVVEYCRDHNEPVGYLVVFVNKDVFLDLQAERDDGFPCFRTGGYTVYYVLVDINEHVATASKRPKPNVITITKDQLVSTMNTETDSEAAENGVEEAAG